MHTHTHTHTHTTRAHTHTHMHTHTHTPRTHTHTHTHTLCFMTILHVQVVEICLQQQLYDGLIHVYNRSLNDYGKPLLELLLLLRVKLKEAGKNIPSEVEIVLTVQYIYIYIYISTTCTCVITFLLHVQYLLNYYS